MKSLPTGLQAHLDGGATTLCTCWKVTRRDGQVLGFTDHDRDLHVVGTTFEAAAGMAASEVQSSLGLSIDNLDVEGALQSARIAETDIASGHYDDAAVEIWRVNWADVSQRVLLRSGNIGEITRGDLAFKCELRGRAHRLQESQGRVYSYTCDAQFGDSRCQFNAANPPHRVSGTVASVDGPATVRFTGIGDHESGWFDNGSCAFVDQTLFPSAFEIQSHVRVDGDTAIVNLWTTPVNPMAIGAGATLTAGCDKTFETCRQKFANHLNFRGFPHMPGNDVLTEYPTKDDANLDGGSRYE